MFDVFHEGIERLDADAVRFRERLGAVFQHGLPCAIGEVAVAWYKFEGIKLRLADNTLYSPDFFVMLANGELEAHEVKGGFWTDDARAKIKIAASM